MKKFLVVGGSGFLGSHLIKSLLDEQIDVTVSDIIGPESALRIKPYMDSIHYQIVYYYPFVIYQGY